MTDTEDPPTLADLETCEACLRSIMGERVRPDMSCRACSSRVLAALTERTQRAASRPKPPEPVDFSYIPPRQMELHGRLINWGRSCNGGASDDTAPMFQQFQSNNSASGGYARDTNVPVDRSDASVVGRGVYYLPQPHMIAVQWYYVKRTSILHGRRSLVCTAEALARYVIDARTMLINRGV